MGGFLPKIEQHHFKSNFKYSSAFFLKKKKEPLLLSCTGRTKAKSQDELFLPVAAKFYKQMGKKSNMLQSSQFCCMQAAKNRNGPQKSTMG